MLQNLSEKRYEKGSLACNYPRDQVDFPENERTISQFVVGCYIERLQHLQKGDLFLGEVSKFSARQIFLS